jgi:hypothetical protein
MPGYNDWRRACGLSSFDDWADMVSATSPQLVDRLSAVYEDVEDVDLFTGVSGNRGLCLSNNFCRKFSVEKFLSNNFCRTISVQQFLSNNFCPTISVEKFLSKNFCRKISVEKILSKNFCRKISVEKFLSNNEQFLSNNPCRSIPT